MSNAVSKQNGAIVIYMQANNSLVPVPYELQGAISQEKWDSRLAQTAALCRSFGKPLLERIHLGVAIVLAIAVPIVVNRVMIGVFRNRIDGDDNKLINDSHLGNFSDADRKLLADEDKDFALIHLATMGSIIGVLVLVWLPMIIWKLVGLRRAKAVSRRWAVEDGMSGPAAVPLWNIRLPDWTNTQGRLVVNLPSGASFQPSLFNPQAYMPPYIQQQPDQPQFPPPTTAMQWQTQPDARPLDSNQLANQYQHYARAPNAMSDAANPFADPAVRARETDEKSLYTPPDYEPPLAGAKHGDLKDEKYGDDHYEELKI